MKRLLGIIFVLFFASAQAQTVPILMFHHVTANDKPSAHESVQEGRFEEYLQMLWQGGYQTVTVSELVEMMAAGNVSEKTVAITLDDGWHSNITAVALLDKYKMKATLYVLSGAFGDSSYLSKAELRTLANKKNIEIGAHTHSHLMEWGPTEAKLDTMSNPIIIGEMFQSKALIEEVIGKKVYTFAWPFGYIRPAARDLAPAMGFTSIVETNPVSKNGVRISPLRLQRLNIDGRCSAAQLKKMVDTGILDKCK